MREMTFKFKVGSKEVPKRFHGQVITLEAPTTLAEVKDRFTDELKADEAKATAAIDRYVTGQGIDLTLQKWAKEYTNVEAVEKETDLAKAIELVRVEVNGRKFGEPSKRGEGTGTVKVKLERAEAEKEEAKAKVADLQEQMRETYESLPRNARKGMRERLLARGTFTEAELDEMDARG